MSAGYSVYVIRLSEAVLKRKKFRDRNPGYKANKYAREFGLFLLRKRCLLGLDRASAEREEVRVAAWLRGQGWAVWQG